MFMLRSSPGKNKSSRLINIRRIQEEIGPIAMKQLIVIHALTGCDTTSALYGHGKVSAFKRLTGKKADLESSDILGKDNATQTEVSEAGIQLLIQLYGGKRNVNINILRHSMYMSMCSTNATRPLPERLPPTERAAHYHCLRVHLQVLQWKHLSTSIPHMNATEWGWKFEQGHFEPIATDLKPAPDDILKVIRCSCKSTSKNQCGSNSCSCRKNGLHCVSACAECHADACMNSEPVVVGNYEDVESSDDNCELSTDQSPSFVNFNDQEFMGDWMGEEEDVFTDTTLHESE